MTNGLIMLLVSLVGFAMIIAEFCAGSYEDGVRVGYEKGLEDGIRMTNEVLTEPILTEGYDYSKSEIENIRMGNGITKEIPKSDCPWR